MKNKISYIIFGLIVCIFSLSAIKLNNDTKTMQTSATTISNKTIGWGIKRAKNHKQPDVGTTNKKILDQYNGICMGNSNDKYVYLTFDNGYENGYTQKILEVLKESKVPATFFITAHYLNTQPQLVKQMIEDGHIVGNHTVNHKSMPSLSEEEIKKEVMQLHSAVYQKFKYEMKYIRPPKGEYNQKTVAYTNTLGYKTVMWSLAYDDWDNNKQGRETYGKQRVLENIHPGAIILLHATSKDNSNILAQCIKEIRNMGYEFKSLDEFRK